MSGGGVQGGGLGDSARARSPLGPVLIGAGVGGGVMGTAVSATLHRIDATGRVGGSVDLAKTLLLASRVLMACAGPMLLKATHPGEADDDIGRKLTERDPATIGVCAGVIAGGVAGESVHMGYSLLFAPSGAFNPGDMAGNLAGRYSRSGDVPNKLVARVISMLRR